MNKSVSLVQNSIEQRIYLIRGKKVMLDRDLAFLYGVETKVLNQAVKRNWKDFLMILCFNLIEAKQTLQGHKL